MSQEEALFVDCHLRNNYFIKKKNCRKKKHCSLIVFALIFWWSIHVCNRLKKKKNCRWSWWSIHLRNNYFIKKKNCPKKKHCSVIVFALIFRWSINVCNTLKKKKNCRWSWWSIHLRNNYFIKKKNRRKRKHCSVIVFALIFRWSIHVCNRFKKKKLSINTLGHDGQYTCIIFILFKKKIVTRESTVRWLSLLWYFDGQYTCVIDKKKKNCWWSWWSIHLRNIYFILKKNCRKKKHCSVIVFALIFWWSIHVCNIFF